MTFIRRAQEGDILRLAEIEVFNYRINFYPIFQNDDFYFKEYTTQALIQAYRMNPERLKNTFVFDDGCVKGFICVSEGMIRKLFVEPVLQGRGIGKALLMYAVQEEGAYTLWALEKNTRAIAFYRRHGFEKTGDKMPEDDTNEFLVRLERR